MSWDGPVAARRVGARQPAGLLAVFDLRSKRCMRTPSILTPAAPMVAPHPTSTPHLASQSTDYPPRRALVFTQTQQMLDIVEKHAQAQVGRQPAQHTDW